MGLIIPRSGAGGGRWPAARQNPIERVLVSCVKQVFSRDELAAAFETFEQTVARAAETKDWDAWVEHYTPDVDYIEHAAGGERQEGGRGVLPALTQKQVAAFPGKPHDSLSVAVVGHRRADRARHL